MVLWPSQGPPYIRKRVACPLRKGCAKARGCTFTQTFGQLEVIGYLGGWVFAAGRFPQQEQRRAR
eukprot:5823302-Lingulodinium_polyedra.AAC.1